MVTILVLMVLRLSTDREAEMILKVNRLDLMVVTPFIVVSYWLRVLLMDEMLVVVVLFLIIITIMFDFVMHRMLV